MAGARTFWLRFDAGAFMRTAAGSTPSACFPYTLPPGLHQGPRSRRLDQAEPTRLIDRLASRMDGQPLIDALDVRVHGVG